MLTAGETVLRAGQIEGLNTPSIFFPSAIWRVAYWLSALPNSFLGALQTRPRSVMFHGIHYVARPYTSRSQAFMAPRGKNFAYVFSFIIIVKILPKHARSSSETQKCGISRSPPSSLNQSPRFVEEERRMMVYIFLKK